MRFGNGLPRQCAHWLAMTGFFDSLRNTTQRVVFLYFSRSAQQNRRGSNSLPGIPRMAEPFAGALPLPLDLTRFAQVEAASSSLPAAHSKKNTPSCRMVFLYFSRSAQQNRRGSNSLPGIPRMAEPFAGALPSPLDLTRCALVEVASSSLPAAFQKENTILTDGVSFCDCPQVLLSVNQCLLSCFSGDVVAPSSKSVTT